MRRFRMHGRIRDNKICLGNKNLRNYSRLGFLTEVHQSGVARPDFHLIGLLNVLSKLCIYIHAIMGPKIEDQSPYFLCTLVSH